MRRAWSDVGGERDRQIALEGWTPAHDDRYVNGELVRAAICYAARSSDVELVQLEETSIWPWDAAWWKPTDARRNLVKAAALLLAEIERLDRISDTKDVPA